MSKPYLWLLAHPYLSAVAVDWSAFRNSKYVQVVYAESSSDSDSESDSDEAYPSSNSSSDSPSPSSDSKVDYHSDIYTKSQSLALEGNVARVSQC